MGSVRAALEEGAEQSAGKAQVAGMEKPHNTLTASSSSQTPRFQSIPPPPPGAPWRGAEAARGIRFVQESLQGRSGPSAGTAGAVWGRAGDSWGLKLLAPMPPPTPKQRGSSCGREKQLPLPHSPLLPPLTCSASGPAPSPPTGTWWHPVSWLGKLAWEARGCRLALSSAVTAGLGPFCGERPPGPASPLGPSVPWVSG